MAQWHVIRESREHGPFDDARLKKLASSGRLKPDDQVRRENTATVRMAKEIKGLFAPATGSTGSPPAIAAPPSPVENTVREGVPLRLWRLVLPTHPAGESPSGRVFRYVRAGCFVAFSVWFVGFLGVLALFFSLNTVAPEFFAETQQVARAKQEREPAPRSARNTLVNKLHSRLEHPLEAMDDAAYAAVVQAIDNHDPNRIAPVLASANPYSLFDASELAAMEEAIGGRSIMPEVGLFTPNGKYTGNSTPMPVPLAYWCQISDLTQPPLTGAFFRTSFTDEARTMRESREFKALWYEPTNDGFRISRIEFHGKDGIETHLTVFGKRITEAVVKRGDEYHDGIVPRQRRVFDTGSNSYKWEEYVETQRYTSPGEVLFRIEYEDDGSFRVKDQTN